MSAAEFIPLAGASLFIGFAWFIGDALVRRARRFDNFLDRNRYIMSDRDHARLRQRQAQRLRFLDIQHNEHSSSHQVAAREGDDLSATNRSPRRVGSRCRDN